MNDFFKILFWDEKKGKWSSAKIIGITFFGVTIVTVLYLYFSGLQTVTTSGAGIRTNVTSPNQEEKNVNVMVNRQVLTQADIDAAVNKALEEKGYSQPNNPNQKNGLNPFSLASNNPNTGTYQPVNPSTFNNPTGSNDNYLLQKQIAEQFDSIREEMRNSIRDLKVDMNTQRTNSSTQYLGQNQNNNGSNDQMYGQSTVIIDSFKSDPAPFLVNDGTKTTSIRIGKGINAGQLIHAVLTTGCLSSGGKCPLRVTVTENISFNNLIVIPAGAYFMGYGQADPSVRKVFITLEKLCIGKREIDVKAHLIDEKTDQPGFISKYIDKTMSTLIWSSILTFGSIYMQSQKDKIFIISDTGVPVEIDKKTVNNGVIDGLTASVNQFQTKLMDDASRMGYIMVVNNGIKGKIFLDEKIPLEALTD